MSKPNPYEQQKQAAYAVLRRAKRPPSVSLTQWRHLMLLLKVIARYQPACYYSQPMLAEKTMLSTRSVRRYVALAQDLGLLVVIPNAGIRGKQSPRATNKYHIVELPANAAKVAVFNGAKLAHNSKPVLRTGLPTKRESSIPEVPPTGGTSSISDSAGLRPTEAPTEGRDVPRLEGESDAEFRQRVQSDAGSRRITRRPRRGDLDPARNLGQYFAAQWNAEVYERDNTGRFRDMRPMDSTKEVVGYIRTVFLHPAAGRVYTEDEVRRFIDLFLRSVLIGDVTIKTGQTPWRCFTGWWGRTEVVRYDDVEAYKRWDEKHRKKKA